MKEIKYEEAVKKLEEIVEKMENGELSLEENVKLYKQGIEYSDFCIKCLEEARLKIKKLSEINEETE